MPLKVTIGSSRHPDSFQQCQVNIDSEPTFVSSKNFEGYITVRIKNHRPTSNPIAPSSSNCSYFDGHSRVFSLQWQGRFKATNSARPDGLWTANDVMFVAEVDDKIKPPPGLSLVKRFMKFIDPSIRSEGILNKQRPWLGSYLVTGMNVLRVWKSGTWPMSDISHHAQQDQEQEQQQQMSVGPWYFFGSRRLEEGNVEQMMMVKTRQGQDQSQEGVVVHNKADGSNINIREQTSHQRRKFFKSQHWRERAIFDPQLVIAGDFFNNFTDFERRRASMIVSIRMDRVIGDQALRFVCRSIERDTCKEHQSQDERGLATTAGGDSIEERNKRQVEEVEIEEEVVFFVVQLEWEGDGLNGYK